MIVAAITMPPSVRASSVAMPTVDWFKCAASAMLLDQAVPDEIEPVVPVVNANEATW